MEDDDAPFDLELWFGITVEIPAWLGELLQEIFEPSWMVRIFWGAIFLAAGALALLFGLYLSYACQSW